MGPPFMAEHCVSKQIGRHDAACQDCPRCVSRSPEARLPGRRALCAFPNLRCCPRCWLFSCLGLWSHPRISPKEHQKERCDHYSVAALLYCFLWCASNYSVVGRIICHSSHDNARTNVCQRLFAENFFLLMPLLDRTNSISKLFFLLPADFALSFSNVFFAFYI